MYLVLRIVSLFLLIGQVWNSGASQSETYLGCFRESPLDKTKDHSLFPFSPFKCFKLCASTGFSFVEIYSNSSICHCGRRISSRPIKENETLCDPCVQDKSISCGGKETLSLYNLSPSNVKYGTDEGDPDVEIILGLEGAVVGLHPVYLNEIILANTSDPETSVEAVDFHFTRREFFASWSNYIYRFPFKNNGSAAEVMYMSGSCAWSVFTLDWVHDHLFWPNCEANSIMISDLNGNNTYKFVRLPYYHVGINDIIVDPYTGMLFWIFDGSLELTSCELDGRNLRVVLSRPSFMSTSSLALDTKERILYVAGDLGDSAVVFQVQYDGSDFHQVFSRPSDLSILGFGIFRSYLYFFSYLPPDNQTVLFKAPLGVNVTQEVKLRALKESSTLTKKWVNHMKLVQSELQSPGRIDDCLWRRCSHHCVVRNSVARCLCPRRYDLGADGYTCTKNQEEDSKMVYKVLLALICVVLVLLSAGVLMCMVDKFWSRIHPTVVRVTRRNPLQRSPIFRQSLERDDST